MAGLLIAGIVFGTVFAAALVMVVMAGFTLVEALR